MTRELPPDSDRARRVAALAVHSHPTPGDCRCRAEGPTSAGRWRRRAGAQPLAQSTDRIVRLVLRSGNGVNEFWKPNVARARPTLTNSRSP
jgi:hypothetical protein